jgi:hypothetical protein
MAAANQSVDAWDRLPIGGAMPAEQDSNGEFRGMNVEATKGKVLAQAQRLGAGCLTYRMMSLQKLSRLLIQKIGACT